MDPAAGRFESQDPKCQGNNWFSYVHNSPGNYLDATGKLPLSTPWSIGLFFGFLFGALFATLYDPSEETNLRVYITVGGALCKLAATISGLNLLFSGTASFFNWARKYAQKVQDNIDAAKESTGPGSMELKLGAEAAEQMLYLIQIDTD